MLLEGVRERFKNPSFIYVEASFNVYVPSVAHTRQAKKSSFLAILYSDPNMFRLLRGFYMCIKL